MAITAFLLLSSLIQVHRAFNIDTEFPILKEIAAKDAYFGYSVAQHARTKGSTNYDRIIVGAPLAVSDDALLQNFGTTGALFSCPANVDSIDVNNCEELLYPDTENLLSEFDGGNTDNSENKTSMWLGVNVRSGGDGEIVVGCAHRYKIVARASGVYGIGMCFLYESDLTIHSSPNYRSPCVGSDMTSGNSASAAFGVCAAGMSLDVKERDMVFGVPGARVWRGTLAWSKLPNTKLDSISNKIADPLQPGFTGTGLDSYLGSSSLIANNLLNDNKKVAVMGSPREDDNGTVFVYELTNELSFLKKIGGQQFGSAFGHSTAVVDIKADEHPTLLVGAPFYRSEDDKIPDGAVYIYYNLGDGIDLKSQSSMLFPSFCTNVHCSNAQFGYAIASIGDINGDRLNDVAVGAPYFETGAVYIYNGMSNGRFAEKPSQIIMASDLTVTGLTRSLAGFGISISGGNDMDGQGFTDILVGAHKSSHVVVLRSRPIVSITGKFQLSSARIDPEMTSCIVMPAKKPCISFDICLQAQSSKGSGKVKIKYELTADSGYELVAARRVSFDSELPQSVEENVVELNVHEAEVCFSQLLFITSLKDILKPIRVDLSYTLEPPLNPAFDNLDDYPILDETASDAQPALIEFKKDCRTPQCNTDFAVQMAFTNEKVVNDPNGGPNAFVFNSDEVDILNLQLSLTVQAGGDPAYEPKIFIDLPANLPNYETSTFSHPSTSCSGSGESTTIICIFGRKLEAGAQVNLTLNMKPGGLGPTYSQINVTANTTSTDTVPENDSSFLKVKVVIVTDLELLGSATIGDQVFYGGEVKGSSGMKTDEDIGSLVQHTYTLLNSGTGMVKKVSVNVLWPYEIRLPNSQTGSYLLYLITRPKYEVSRAGFGQCDYNDQDINRLGLTIVENDKINTDSVISYNRKKRAAEAGEKRTSAVRTMSTTDGQTKKVAMLNCLDRTANCLNITCHFINVEPKATIYVRFNARLWNSSLVEAYGSDVSAVEITSHGELIINKNIEVVQRNYENDKHNVTTIAEPDIPDKGPPKVPIWIIIVAACGGLLVLVIIILIMWKCGFFKRHRPMTFEVKVEKSKNASGYKEVPQVDSNEM